MSVIPENSSAPAAAQLGQPVQPAAPAAAEPKAPVILLADDEVPFRELIEAFLLQAGYVVHAVGDGRAALRLLKQVPIDLIISDLCMPGTDGMELLTYLRISRPSPPVIVMSGGVGSNMAGMLQAAELLGARRTLAKPFPLPALAVAVREVLSAPAGGRGTR